MEALVFDPLIFVVVFTVVCSTVDDVGDADILESLSVLGNEVTAQIEEVVDDL